MHTEWSHIHTSAGTVDHTADVLPRGWQPIACFSGVPYVHPRPVHLVGHSRAV